MAALHVCQHCGKFHTLEAVVGRSFFFGSGQCADLCIKMDIEALLQFIYSQYKYRNNVKMYTKL